MKNQFYDIVKKIDKLVQEYSPKNLEVIEESFKFKGVEYYFFTQKLMELKEPAHWLVPLKDKGYFKGEKNPPAEEVKDQPGFYTMPFWNVLKYLENVAQKNKENPKSEITDALIEIIDSIISFRDSNGKRIENYRTDWFVTKVIFMLPYQKWDFKYIDFIGETLNTSFGEDLIQSEIGSRVLPTLIENKEVNLLLKLLNIILGFTKVEEEKHDKIKPVMENYWLRDALKKFKKDIAELCGIEAIEIGLNTIRAILKEDNGKFSNIWITTIEDSSQNKFPEMYECQLVFFVRDMYENLVSEKIKSSIEELLKEKNEVLRRIGVHTINKHYKELGDLFWNWQENPLDELPCKHEIFQLLKMNCLSFSKEQIKKILGWIEDRNYGKYDEERKEEALAYRKKEWLFTLLETGDQGVKTAYVKYDKINPGKIAHAGFSFWSESGIVQHISPIKKEEILSKSNEDIVRYLNEYKEEEKGWSLEQVGEEGLSNCFQQCVLEKPEKYADNLSPFLSIKRDYQQTLLRSFIEAWNAKKDFSVDNVLDFICQIIESESFWNEEYGAGITNYRNRIISQVTEFIESGTNDDKHAFEEKYLPDIEKILFVLAEKAESDISDTERVIDSVLTSPKSCVFSTMIVYSLRIARLLKQKEKIKWPETIRNDFTKRLDRDIETSPDFSLTLGRYIGQILYLDNQWVFENIEKIFPKENPVHWKATFESYLSYSRHVYKETYKLLRENGHYCKALETEFDDYVSEKLVQHICIGFIEDWEKLEEPDSLICLLLKKANTKYLSEVIHFLGTIKEGEPNKKLKERIKPLWKALFDLVSKHENERDFQSLISKLHRWLDIVDEMDDEITEWIKLTAKYINVH